MLRFTELWEDNKVLNCVTRAWQRQIIRSIVRTIRWAQIEKNKKNYWSNLKSDSTFVRSSPQLFLTAASNITNMWSTDVIHLLTLIANFLACCSFFWTIPRKLLNFLSKFHPNFRNNHLPEVGGKMKNKETKERKFLLSGSFLNTSSWSFRVFLYNNFI